MFDTSTLLADLSAACDPVVFANRAGIYPDAWQADVLRSPARQHILLCSRQAGKSTAAATLVCHRAAYWPQSLILLVAPAKQQSGELFLKVKAILRESGIDATPVRDNVNTLELENGSRIVVVAADSGTIRGFSAVDLAVLDESGWIPDKVYHAVRPMLAVSNGKILLLSTPNGRRGFFYEVWKSGGTDWQRTSVTVYDVPRIAAEWIEAEREQLPDWVFRSEYLNEFTDTSAAAFRSIDIEAAQIEEVETWTL